MSDAAAGGDSQVVDMTSVETCVKCSERTEENVEVLSCGHWIHKSCLSTQLEHVSTALDSSFFALARCPSEKHCTLGWADVGLAKEASKKYLEKLASFIMTKTQTGLPVSEVSPKVNNLSARILQLVEQYAQGDTPNKKRKKSRKRKLSAGKGVGFGGSAQTDAKKAATGVTKAHQRNNAADQNLISELVLMRKCLSEIALLPTWTQLSSSSTGKVACDESLVVGHMFLYKSKAGMSLLDVLLSIWRNDSLMDIKTRLTLYSECLTLLEEMASWQETATVLFAKSESEEAESEGAPKSKKRRKESDELSKVLAVKDSSDTLYKLLQKVRAQGKIFLGRGANLETDELGHFIQRLRKVCETLDSYGTKSNLVNGAEKKSRRAVVKRRNALLKAKNLSKEEREKAYSVALDELSFKAVAMSDMIHARMLSHSFFDAAVACTNAVGSNRKRIARISRELSTLSTSLPTSWGSSIFVRADQDRPDLLIALILGPEGTPYQNGAFFFDIWLPGGYPSVPPKVLLTTTGQGQVRFNPNLYANGKVCLSLLGTWSGPGWQSTSTLLQVLISIQSLIMVDEPYFNEPGYESSRKSMHGKRASEEYNKAIRSATLQHAIYGALLNPHWLFKDVLKTHFALKREEIINQCSAWSGSGNWQNAIRAELDKLSQDVSGSSSSQVTPITEINLINDGTGSMPSRSSKAEVICLDDDEGIPEQGQSDIKYTAELVDLT